MSLASQALLLLSWSLAALYGRGILQLGRSDAWFKSVYRLSGHDLRPCRWSARWGC